MQNGQVNFCNTDFSGNLNTHMLLYRGYEKTTHVEPFSSFHEYFKFCLSKSTSVLVIGYAFRDESVNSMLRFALQENKNLHVKVIDVDSNIRHNLPQDQVSLIIEPNKGFGKEAIEMYLKELGGGFYYKEP